VGPTALRITCGAGGNATVGFCALVSLVVIRDRAHCSFNLLAGFGLRARFLFTPGSPRESGFAVGASFRRRRGACNRVVINELNSWEDIIVAGSSDSSLKPPAKRWDVRDPQRCEVQGKDIDILVIVCLETCANETNVRCASERLAQGSSSLELGTQRVAGVIANTAGVSQLIQA
jgi:hypothetical protein